MNKNSRFDFPICRIKRLKSNRSGTTSISILLVVLIALALSGAALFVFLTSDKIVKEIADVRVIEDVYAKEEQINFHLSQGKSLEEAVSLVKGAELQAKKVVVKGEFKDIEVIYVFEPKTKEK